MVELTRKQREIASRTAEILRVARPILLREGFQALSMDRVAAQMEYAKGTIYNHFPNKEEIVLAMAVESMQLRRSLFERASRWQARSRIRMMAIGVACEYFTQNCREDFLVEQWIRNNSIWDKSSENRQNLIRQCELDCMSVVGGIVQDALRDRELLVPSAITPQEFVYGFWAINYGSQILSYSSPSLPTLGIHSPIQAVRMHCMTLLNGFGWHPHMDWERCQSCMEELSQGLKEDFESICNKRGKA